MTSSALADDGAVRRLSVGPADEDIAERVDRVERQFAQLFDGYRNRMRVQAAAFEPPLQPSAYRTLFEVVVSGPVGAGVLADRIGFDRSVLSRQLHQLEELGLVERSPDPTDRRSVVVTATVDAVASIERNRTVARDDFRRNLAAWPVTDLDDLSRLLDGITSMRTDTP